MSEQEKREQIGSLAEEYSKLKGELNHVTEKLARARDAYILAGAAMSSNGILLLGPEDELGFRPQQRSPNSNQIPTPTSLDPLLDKNHLLEAFRTQKRLASELDEVRDRLRALAPHLV